MCVYGGNAQETAAEARGLIIWPLEAVEIKWLQGGQRHSGHITCSRMGGQS